MNKLQRKFFVDNFNHYLESFERMPDELFLADLEQQWVDYHRGLRSTNLSDFSAVWFMNHIKD